MNIITAKDWLVKVNPKFIDSEDSSSDMVSKKADRILHFCNETIRTSYRCPIQVKVFTNNRSVRKLIKKQLKKAGWVVKWDDGGFNNMAQVGLYLIPKPKWWWQSKKLFALPHVQKQEVWSGYT